MLVKPGIMRAKGSLLPATKTYVARVIADGGMVVDLVSVNNAFKMISANGLTVAAAYSSDWGVKKDGSNFVSKLYSLAGASSDLLQASGAAQPLWSSTGQNGHAIITLDGTGHYMDASFTLAQPEHVFMVYKPVSWTGNDAIYDGFSATQMMLFQQTASPQVNMYNAGSVYVTAPNGPTIGQWAQISNLWLQNNYSYRVNGATLGTPTAGGSVPANGFTLGRRGSTAGNYANISVGEIIVCSANQTSQQAAVEAYLKAKWGTP